jgi:hypothetical protein
MLPRSRITSNSLARPWHFAALRVTGVDLGYSGVLLAAANSIARGTTGGASWK